MLRKMLKPLARSREELILIAASVCFDAGPNLYRASRHP
jgi:hypothetical protein